MSKMGCGCGYGMSDCDGHIVYDIFFRSNVEAFVKEDPSHLEELIQDVILDQEKALNCKYYIWLCDNCRAAHVWSSAEGDENLYLKYEITESEESFAEKDLVGAREIYAVNVNLDITYRELLDSSTGVFENRYFLSKDNKTVYLTDSSLTPVGIYSLKEKSDMDLKIRIKTFEDLLIYTIEKKMMGMIISIWMELHRRRKVIIHIEKFIS